ncbi:two-component regulator propeller domain-containing protein [Williamwhitmania taraxaci]|nr:two-component regulator propeller domain-containing protein [Williamwhitmania taraxaci]
MFRVGFLLLLLYTMPLVGVGQRNERAPLKYKRDFLTKFEKLPSHNGLISNIVSAIFQDKFGYMWFATDNGLNRYDGIKIVTYKNIHTDTNSLSNNVVTCICEDRKGNLWIGTGNGLNYFDRKSERFSHPILGPVKKGRQASAQIRAVITDSEGGLWVETGAGILHHFLRESNIHEKIAHPKDYSTSGSHLLYQDKGGYIWFGGPSSGPFRYDPRTKNLARIKSSPLDPVGKKLEGVNAILEDTYGTLWLASYEGTHVFDPLEESFFKMFSTPTNSLVQDDAGMIWVGTFDKGIYKFDSKRGLFTNLNNDPNNSLSLADNHVNNIFVDRGGSIWVSTKEGISKYSPNRYKFEHYFHLPEVENSLSSNKTTAFTQDERGNIWIGTEWGLNAFDKENGVFTTYYSDKKSSIKLPSNAISVLFSDKQGSIWIGFSDVPLLAQIEIKTSTIKTFQPSNRSSKSITGIVSDRKGKLWISYLGGGGVEVFNPETSQFDRKDFNPFNQPLDRIITALAVDPRNQNIWIGTFASGIYLLNSVTNNFSLIFPPQNNRAASSSLDKTPAINSCIQLGNKVWFGTSRGLIWVDANTLQAKEIRVFRKQYPISISSIAEGVSQNQLLLGSDEGPYVLNINSEKAKPFLHIDQTINILMHRQSQVYFDNIDKLSYIAAENHLFIFKPGDNSTWKRISLNDNFRITKIVRVDQKTYVTTNLGLYSINKELLKLEPVLLKKNENFVNFDTPINDITINNSKKGFFISEDHIFTNYSNNPTALTSIEKNIKNMGGPNFLCAASVGSGLWVGTEKGLVKYSLNTGKILQFNAPDSSKLVGNNNTSICLVGDNVWVGDDNGYLNIINTKDCSIKHIRIEDGAIRDYGEKLTISQIYVDIRGRVWVVSNKLYCFDTKGKQLRFPFTKDLQNKKVRSVVEDYEGKLWISTDNGLYCINTDNGANFSYFETDGLQGNIFNNGSFRLLDGSIIVGGGNGFNIINPTNIPRNKKIPQVEISGIRAFNQLIGNDFTQTNTITLPYNKNYLTVEMTALDFSSPEKNRYSYKMEGLNSSWINNGNLSTVTFTNLAPGKYILHVKASNNDDLWNNTPKVITIIITPPIWRSWWVVTLLILALAAGVIYIFRMVKDQIKFREKSIELEQRLLLSQMNPHFIFNALTAIQSYIFRNDPKSAGKYLASFAKLVRLILENSRTKYTTIGKEVKTLEHYLELQSLRFDEKFDFKIEIDPDIERETMTIPPMLTQPFIENAIEHGIINVADKGTIVIRYLLLDELILIEVEDDGIGINRATELQKPGQKDHVSLATKISKERLENLNKLEKGKITMQIIDLSSIDHLLHGTKVTFKIPYKWVETSFKNS